MLEKVKLNLRLLAVSNISMSMLGIFLFIRYPFDSVSTNFNPGISILTFLIFFLDLYLNIRLIRSITHIYESSYGQLQKLLFRGYIIISFFTRLVILATSNFIIAPIEGDIILVSLSGVMFAFVLLYLRSLPVAVHVRGRILFIFTINILTLIYIVFPVANDVTFQEISIGYIVVFIIGGMVKWFAYVSSSFVFFTWASNLPDKLKQTQQELYPEEQEEKEKKEVDPMFPEY